MIWLHTHTYTDAFSLKPHPLFWFRPLPPELIKYAREDTHYLLYIYDRQRNELLRRGNKQNNMLCAVIDQSRQLCLKKYEKPIFSEDGYLKLYYKHKRQFNVQQVKCPCTASFS